jgi:hypothetical protein
MIRQMDVSSNKLPVSPVHEFVVERLSSLSLIAYDALVRQESLQPF